jgi:GDP-4-dehydro-6-deoxy-D-mannose reductase
MIGLVTGAGGFIGGYLVDELRRSGCEVHAAVRRPGAHPPPPGSGCTVHLGDLLDPGFCDRLVSQARPDLIYHLAAQSFPERSWKEPAETFHANVVGTVRLLEAVRRRRPEARTLVVSSSSVYAGSDTPLAEDDALQPSSLYAVSKLAQEECARLYGRQYGVPVIRVRPFFLIGPGKTGDVCSDLACRIVAVERGQADSVAVGNLDVVRDFLDVRDGVAALRRLGEQGRPGEVYNVCSGRGHSIRELLEVYRSMATAKIVEQEDPTLRRPIDEPVKVGNPARLRELGWAPVRSLPETLNDILEFWRSKPSTS